MLLARRMPYLVRSAVLGYCHAATTRRYISMDGLIKWLFLKSIASRDYNYDCPLVTVLRSQCRPNRRASGGDLRTKRSE